MNENGPVAASVPGGEATDAKNVLNDAMKYRLLKEMDLSREDILTTRPTQAKLAQEMSQRLGFKISPCNIRGAFATLGIEYRPLLGPRPEGKPSRQALIDGLAETAGAQGVRIAALESKMASVQEMSALTASAVDDQAKELAALGRQLAATQALLNRAAVKLGLAAAPVDASKLRVLP